jgi:hypothetical protein
MMDAAALTITAPTAWPPRRSCSARGSWPRATTAFVDVLADLGQDGAGPAR